MYKHIQNIPGIMHTVQYIPRNMHTVFALLCFVVVIHWLIFPYPSGLLHWHCGNLTIAPVPAKQPWWIWINTSCEFIMNDCITTTKQSTTKPCAYFLGYTVRVLSWGVLGRFKPYSSVLLHWHWGNTIALTIALMPVKQPCIIWVDALHEPTSIFYVTTLHNQQQKEQKNVVCSVIYCDIIPQRLT